jgi:hypothetical protein
MGCDVFIVIEQGAIRDRPFWLASLLPPFAVLAYGASVRRVRSIADDIADN